MAKVAPKHRRSLSDCSGFFEDKDRGIFEYFGWVYHVGVNSIGREYCHLRFLFIRGKHVEMYKRDPHEYPGIKPLRRGVVGHTLLVEEQGLRKVNNRDVYVLRFCSRLDESKKGEIACASAAEARKWLEAFDQAKQQAEYEISRGKSARHKLSIENEINLDGHRHRVRRYAHGLKKLVRIGHGPETLLQHSSSIGATAGPDGFFGGNDGDTIEAHEWKCVRTINAGQDQGLQLLIHPSPMLCKNRSPSNTIGCVRILEDVAGSKNGKGVIVKSVAVVDASVDSVFEVILNLDKKQRYEWDMLTGDLELIDSLDGHYDVVYGTFDPKQLTRWHSKRDFVFSRQWFRGQDGTYTILQLPVVHKKRPPKSGYKRTKINPSTWEIKNLNTSMGSKTPKCLIAQTLEINSISWCRWKEQRCSKFEKTMPYALLCQVAGLKEYIEANPSLKFESPATFMQSKFSDASLSIGDYEDSAVQDEFYDAIAGDSSSSDDDSPDDDNDDKQEKNVKLKNVSWAIASLAPKKISAPDANKELDSTIPPILIDPAHFKGSLHHGRDDNDTNCWAAPSGEGFMIRGKNYLKDNSKVKGGDPLLKLIAVDWFKGETIMNKVALNPRYLVQSEAGKKLPFVLLINLQIPAKPNYSLVMYYASDRPVSKDSSLGKFVDGTDVYRDSKFKLIPSIVQGYWMVKRAVGTKACLLGKAVTCKYLRQDNLLEIDVDIGSSSVAKSIIGLVLGYVTSLVVDLAILVEAKEEHELPEYILGTVRLNRVKPESAISYEY